MNCTKCGGPKLKARMFLMNATSVSGIPSIKASALPLVGDPIQPLWAFIVSGLGAIGLGIWVGLETHWELLVLHGTFIGIGVLVLLWTITPWRREAVRKWGEHQVWLEKTWICAACGDLTED